MSADWWRTKQPSHGDLRILACLSSRAVELQVSFVLLLRLYSAHRCAAGTFPIRKAETVDSALVDRIGPNDGDVELTSRFSAPNLISNQIQIFYLTAVLEYSSLGLYF